MSRIILMWFTVASLMTSFAGCVAVVRTPPPPARVEVRTAIPYPDAVWIDGYWQYRHGGWVWIEGRWSKRPWLGAVWVPGHWRETPGGWKWIAGHWK